jgi:hypothetical protein
LVANSQSAASSIPSWRSGDSKLGIGASAELKDDCDSLWHEQITIGTKDEEPRELPARPVGSLAIG